jgi:glycosyltransferase involved in cell wall biosynthesis
MTQLSIRRQYRDTRGLAIVEPRSLAIQPISPLPLPTRIAVIGNHLPRQCGIATFTTDLCAAIASEYRSSSLFAIPINDPECHYEYPERVRLEIDQDDPSSYERAGEFLNFNGNDLVCLQHEYGIFGGRAGGHILKLIRKLTMPLVVTLHTVLRTPDGDQRAVLAEIATCADRLIVMSHHAASLLHEVYGVPADTIDVIPHGVPDLPFTDPSFFKDRFGVEGKQVILTFGLLSPNKGIENVIRALPAILQEHPKVVYMVSGATHPHLKKREGESYRSSLQSLAKELGVSEHVIFHNRFVSAQEMIEHVGAADIYVTPYRNEEQAVSGTLALAVGAGKAVISTPYWHAKELLADKRGVLVPFDDPAALGRAAIALLDDQTERNAMRKHAYLYSRGTTWHETARAYMASFQRARLERTLRPRPLLNSVSGPELHPLPPLNLTHLRRLTDDTGMLQHAIFSLPNFREGYTTDDNARALIVATLLQKSSASEAGIADELSDRYTAFLWLAIHPDTGRFRNFLGYDRGWLEDVGSEDSHGRALWALGTVLCHSKNAGLRGAAGRLFENATPATEKFTSPRAWSFCLLGMQAYLACFPGDRMIQNARTNLAERLLDVYERSSSQTWHWFEKSLSYSNARLPQALLSVGWHLDHKRMKQVGFESLEWLCAHQHREEDNLFVPIGSDGFFTEGSEKARFDQQPVEACATISACLEAYRLTAQERWLDEAWCAFRWFLGQNDLQIALYDPTTGGCRDGLHPDRVNENQGAESTLSYLMAFLEMQEISSLTSESSSKKRFTP